MRAKFILLTVLLFALPLFCGCGSASGKSTGETPQTTTEVGGESEPEESGESEISEETEESQSEVTIMYITINSNKLQVELAQNTSVDALVNILRQNDITYTADDYGDFEKVGNIGYTLPRNDEQINTEAGDVILYQGCNICLYYGTNSWSFTRIGKINGYSASELRELLNAGGGSVQVTLSLN